MLSWTLKNAYLAHILIWYTMASPNSSCGYSLQISNRWANWDHWHLKIPILLVVVLSNSKSKHQQTSHRVDQSLQIGDSLYVLYLCVFLLYSICTFLVYNIVVEPIISSPKPQASKNDLQEAPKWINIIVQRWRLRDPHLHIYW
jgi:hypothetical protein